ncbi:AraC family transcriptional regulator [Rubrivivax sp. JA1026]|uniref:AraC family transcriptional regulator n=1 Tax=Rubrivivax sp. JA1026 TaxID=2710888 RepID=UPI0013E95209|nr:AraC family transcriptional regulator [Rubrivivax sp. JA1026]
MRAAAPAGDTAATVPFTHQPALVLELARAQELDVGAIRAAAGLADMPAALTLAQWRELLAATLRAFGSAEAPFVLGRHLLPGHYGAASHALREAASLRDALERLVRFQPRLSPLLVPRLHVEGGLAVLYWTDACRLGALRPALVEMQMSAVASCCRWLAGRALPWTFCFDRAAARHAEQHEVHLGTALRFGCQLDAMLIDAHWLDEPWPAAAHPGAVAASRAAEQAAGAEAMPRALLAALYDLLLDRIGDPPALEEAAAAFGFSPATFKRRLAQEGTHYQAELDQVRRHECLRLFRFGGLDNEAAARHLGFHDAANFRRSFKRWTGSTPALLRRGLFDFSV